MGKFTPGPWFVDEYGVSSDAVLGIARTYHAATRVMWSGSDLATLAHCEANARLIAAAPLLLEQLITARDYVAASVASMREAYKGYPHRYAQEEADLSRIDAAIAAARGEA